MGFDSPETYFREKGQHMTIYGAAEKVARGAAMLDSRYPGWERLINVHNLDLGDPQYCILGQLNASSSMTPFSTGLEDLFGEGASLVDAIAHGFDSPYGYSGYPELDAAWKTQIYTRRGV